MVLDFIKDNLGKVMMAVGAFLLIAAVLTSEAMFGSVISAVSLFFGIVLVFFGFSSILGFFSSDLRNLGGVGTILISIAVVCFAFSISAAQFMTITKVLVVADVFKGGIMGWSHIAFTVPTYAWFTGIMIYASLITFISGIAAKVLHALR